MDNLIKSIDWPASVYEELKALSKEAKCFRQYAKDARDKLLAHLDKQIILSNKTLGKFPPGADERFLESLETICNITHKVCFGSIFPISAAEAGDVLNLKRVLSKALAFDKLLSEGTEREKARMEDYLQDALKTSGKHGT